MPGVVEDEIFLLSRRTRRWSFEWNDCARIDEGNFIQSKI